MSLTTTFIAYATGNGTGADAGISVYRKTMEDGQVRDEQEVASWTAPGTELDDTDGTLSIDAAEEQLARMGYQMAGSWFASGGQEGAEVEPLELDDTDGTLSIDGA